MTLPHHQQMNIRLFRI